MAYPEGSRHLFTAAKFSSTLRGFISSGKTTLGEFQSPTWPFDLRALDSIGTILNNDNSWCHHAWGVSFIGATRDARAEGRSEEKTWVSIEAMVLSRKIHSHFASDTPTHSTTPLPYRSVIVYRYLVDGIEYEGKSSGRLVKTAGSVDEVAASMRLDGLIKKGSTIPILVDPRNPRNSYFGSE